MEHIGFLKKPKSRYIPLHGQICLVKAFKIMGTPEPIDIRTCFDVLLDVFVSKGHETFQIMGKLASIEGFKAGFDFIKLKPFYKFLNKHDIRDFSAYFDDDFDLGIHYWDMPLHPEDNSNQKRLVELFIAIPDEWYCLDEVRAIISKLDAVIGLSYAYVSFVPQDACIDLERRLETWEKPSGHGMFAPLSTEVPRYNGFNMKKVLEALEAQAAELAARNAIAEGEMEKINAEKRERIRNVDSGYIPKLQPVNFYNRKQLEHLREETIEKFEKLSNNLTLVTYTETNRYHQE